MEAYVLYERFGFIPWQTEIEYDTERREGGMAVFRKQADDSVLLEEHVLSVPTDRLIAVKAKENTNDVDLPIPVKNTDPEGLSTTRSKQETRNA